MTQVEAQLPGLAGKYPTGEQVDFWKAGRWEGPHVMQMVGEQLHEDRWVCSTKLAMMVMRGFWEATTCPEENPVSTEDSMSNPCQSCLLAEVAC